MQFGNVCCCVPDPASVSPPFLSALAGNQPTSLQAERKDGYGKWSEGRKERKEGKQNKSLINVCCVADDFAATFVARSSMHVE